jgi:GNAT superfamily N-acetyltransferase
MPLATWWHSDPLPDLAELPQFSAHASTDISLLASMVRITENEVHTRIQAGSIPYIAYMDQVPAAYGWVASRIGDVVEINLHFALPARNCYLWDFVTLPDWRGEGIYPHLLQSIIKQESTDFDRFWILYSSFNLASRAGIHKAGFQSILEFNFNNEGIQIQALVNSDRVPTAAKLLGIPIE